MNLSMNNSKFNWKILYTSFFLLFFLCFHYLIAQDAIGNLYLENFEVDRSSEDPKVQTRVALKFEEIAMQCIKQKKYSKTGASSLFRAAELNLKLNKKKKARALLKLLLDNYSNSSWVTKTCELLFKIEMGFSNNNLVSGFHNLNNGNAKNKNGFDYTEWQRVDQGNNKNIILYMISKKNSNPAYPGYPNIVVAKESCSMDISEYEEQSEEQLMSASPEIDLNIEKETRVNKNGLAGIFRKISYRDGDIKVFQNQYSLLDGNFVYIFNLAHINSKKKSYKLLTDNFEKLIDSFNFNH